MKNKFIVLSISFVIIALVSAYLFVLPTYYEKKAHNYYNNGQFEEAAFYYGKIDSKEQIDLDNLYYYADSLTKLTPSILVQENLLQIIKTNSSSTAAYIAQKRLNELKSDTIKAFGANYVDKVSYNTGILRWDVSKMPLKVAFTSQANVAVPQYYIDYIRDSFARWQSATGNLINFAYVDNYKNADIKVVFSDITDTQKCQSEDCKYGLAFTTPKIKSKILKQMEIKFRVKDTQNNNYTKLEMYNVALHEIGHALGLMGHSFNTSDIMYPVAIDKVYNVAANAFDVFRSDITYRDINTLMLLYKLVPDISNSSNASYLNKDFLLSEVVLGDAKVQTIQKIEQAQKYIKTAPESTEGWIDLASAYAESGLDKDSIKALDSAMNVAVSQDDRFNIYYNYAAVFINSEEYNSAVTYAGYALEIYPENEDAKSLLGYAEAMLERYDDAQKVLNEVVASDPANIDYSCNLATVYFKQFNFVQGARVLNALVKNNPEAKKDSRVRMNMLLMAVVR